MPKKITDENILKQKEILLNIYQILDISGTNNSFILQDIDNDIDKQNAIYALETDIRKNFICGNWACFKKEQNDNTRKWYNMIKSICKEFDVDVHTKRKSIKKENGFITCSKVIFTKTDT